MTTLVNTLIVFFIILILYQLGLANRVREGIENNQQYKEYDMNNPANALILAQQNAGNISYIKQRLDNIQGLDKEVHDISGNVVSLQDQVNAIVNGQKQYADQMTGGKPPEVSGTT
ncbi:MAG: hypothetical protein MUP82_07440 [Candidatus Marinimicrobia bacterium]|nr:hypothetical protein [Candidatus Neomarinimicrobiota bacterium]